MKNNEEKKITQWYMYLLNTFGNVIKNAPYFDLSKMVFEWHYFTYSMMVI